MPRVAREYNKTITNTYHIIIRGINKQDIFFDEEDRLKFLKELKGVKEQYKFKIYAFVLMTNHVHLTICDDNGMMSQIMHRLCTIYAIYFNKKYERIGHVFQNRFKNICVDKESYLLDLVRYIHNNPQNAGICNHSRYRWSSYRDYVENLHDGITDIDFVLELFNKDRKKSIYRFKEFSNREKNFFDTQLEFDYTITDEVASEVIKSKLKINDISKIKHLNNSMRDAIIYNVSEIEGITLKQISRIFNMSERNVQRIVKKCKMERGLNNENKL